MILFDNIFAASYKFYSGENDQVRLRASLFVTLSEILISIIILNILLGNDWIKVYLNFKHAPQVGGLLFLVITAINYYYYSNIRINKVMTRFEKKSKTEVIVWNIIAITSIICPVLYELFTP